MLNKEFGVFCIVSCIFINCNKHFEFTQLVGTRKLNSSNVSFHTRINSASICASICALHLLCLSFAYHHEKAKCKLSSTRVNGHNLQGTDGGWNYYIFAEYCPYPWILNNLNCYYFESNDPLNFTESQHFCSNHQSYLVKIDGINENAFIKSIITTTGKPYWIGLSEILNTWVWKPSMEEVLYTDWGPGQPNTGDKEPCVAFMKDLYPEYNWHDVGCSHHYMFICEKAIRN